MTALQLALSELKRMTSGVLPKVAIIALTIVPLLYGAVYLYANWDPQSRMGNITAALVVDDQGANDPEGHRVMLGHDVATSLHQAHSFTWQDVATMAEAEQGVREGRYAFVVRIPKDFSADLLSTGNIRRGDENRPARRALLEVVTNDANNYTLNTFVDRLVTEVHASVATKVGTRAADALLTSFGAIHTSVAKAASGADSLHQGTTRVKNGAADLTRGSKRLHDGAATLDDGVGTLAGGQKRLQQGANQLQQGTRKLSGGLKTMDDHTTTLVSDTQRLADGSATVAAANNQLNKKVQGAIATIKQAPNRAREILVSQTRAMVADGSMSADQAQQLLARFDDQQKNSAALAEAHKKLDQASTDMQRLADGSQQVADGNRRLAVGMPALRKGIVDAHAGAVKVSTGASQLSDGLHEASRGVGKLKDGSSQLRQGTRDLHQGAATLWRGSKDLDAGAGQLATRLNAGAEAIPNPSPAKKQNVSSVMGNPVGISKVAQARATTYGAGLAPFFLSLALWVGTFMLVQAMRPITRRALTSNARSWRIAVGGWIPFWVVSAVQATILLLVVHFVLGLAPASLPLTWLFMLLATMAFSAIIQGTVALFGTPGKFVVLIMLVLQLVSSGGTLPWQLTPQPLHVVHDIMPMSHVVEGMRRLIYGSDIASVKTNAWMLVGYTLFGLALSILAARRHKTWTLKTLQPEIAI